MLTNFKVGKITHNKSIMPEVFLIIELAIRIKLLFGYSKQSRQFLISAYLSILRHHHSQLLTILQTLTSLSLSQEIYLQKFETYNFQLLKMSPNSLHLALSNYRSLYIFSRPSIAEDFPKESVKIKLKSIAVNVFFVEDEYLLVVLMCGTIQLIRIPSNGEIVKQYTYIAVIT